MNFDPYRHFVHEAELARVTARSREAGGDDWWRFLGYAEAIELAAGQVVVRQGDAERDLYILAEGTVEVRARVDPSDPERHLADVDASAVFGEQSFLDARPRTATVLARTDVTVFRLTPDAFDRVCEEEPRLACWFLYDVARALSLRSRA